MKFLFKAKTESGDLKEGLVEALSREVAVSILQQNGLIPLDVKEEEQKGMAGFAREVLKLFEGVSPKELMVIFRQLATLINSHVPIVTSLKTIAQQTNNRYLQVILKEVEEDIQDGMSFSESLEKHPKDFDTMTINILRAGEVAGNLQKAIEFVAESIEKNYLLRAKIRGALFYPGFVVSVAVAVGFLVMTFILPKITTLIKDMQVPVPWYTQVLISMSDTMNQYWWAFVGGAVLLGVGIYYYFSSPSGKKERDILVLQLPVFRTLARNIYITRFSENLSALMASGIPVVRALMITSDVIGNSVYTQILLHAAEEVRAGGTMSTIFDRFPDEIPPIVTQMVRIGEETGTISQVLSGIASFYNQEVDVMTRNLASLIEPIMIVVLGIGVGVLTIGILMPVYNIAGQIQ